LVDAIDDVAWTGVFLETWEIARGEKAPHAKAGDDHTVPCRCVNLLFVKSELDLKPILRLHPGGKSPLQELAVMPGQAIDRLLSLAWVRHW